MGHHPANWCRHELKYVISETQAATMIKCVRPLVPPDSHANGGAYSVVTQYLDSGDLRLCRESLEGVKNRYKLRIRSYTDAPDTPYSFEIKRRMNRIVAKSRAWVRRVDARSVLNDRRRLSDNKGDRQENLGQFLHYQAQLHAAPVLSVRYLREAFESPCGNHLRVTFDRRLYFNTTVTPHIQLDGRGWQPFPGNPVVLEIKFTAWFPAWLGRIIRILGIQDRSFSKYALSVKHACGRHFCAPKLARWACDE